MKQLAEAVSELVTAPDAATMLDAVLTVSRVAVGYPVVFGEPSEYLNPLLDLAKRDKPGFDRVIALVDSKRSAVGLPPLRSDEPSKFDKSAYMREFMDRKRQRQKRAVDIENMCRAEKDALRGRARLDFQDKVAAKWKEELDSRLENARAAAGARLPKETNDAIRRQFWEYVDAQLDAAEAAAMDKIRRR